MKLCECGCGEPAPIAKHDHRLKGHIKGQPVRFVNGHNNRGLERSEATRGKMAAYALARPPEHHAKLVARRRERPATSTVPSNVHAWLARRHKKTGRCEECGRIGKTDFSFQKHPEPHTFNRNDYRELCRSCHVSFDYAIGMRGAA